jgi:NAD(P)-dependent dehydrogenase (short-subunit alcohol dehydrogenase family)
MSNFDKSILITGCSSGIGYCVATGLRQRGYRVFATCRQQKDVDRLRQEGFESLQLDVSDSESINRCMDEILDMTGNRLYGLFNNGAYGQPGAIEDLGRDALREQFETNLFGWHELTNRIIPVMRAQGEGRILYNSSILGFIAMPYRGAYNASKYALEGLVDTLRLELHDTGIQLSLIEPGPITSRFRENAIPWFEKNIDVTNSPHADKYQATIKRLAAKGPVMPFTLPPDAVLKRIIHALQSRRAHARYYVTFPTYLFGFLKRILPTRALDWIIRKV